MVPIFSPAAAVSPCFANVFKRRERECVLVERDAEQCEACQAFPTVPDGMESACDPSWQRKFEQVKQAPCYATLHADRGLIYATAAVIKPK